MIRSGSGMPAVSSACSKRRVVDRLGRELAARDALGELARGAHDLVAGAVVEGDDELQAAIADGHVLRLLDQAADVGGKRLALADDADLHVVARSAPRGRCG